MSTQDDAGISFEISNEKQNFRLLELPPSLLALIASEHPPKYVLAFAISDLRDEQSANMSESLWLKSAESPSANVGSKQPSPSAVLCTDDHTYQLRQVQSSNSVFILQPSESRGDDNEMPSPGLSAISQCTATLELIPSDDAASFAMLSRLLKKTLPPYTGTDTEVGSETDTTFPRRTYEDKNAILQNAPFSAAEFDRTWKHLCAFIVLGRAWLPTPSALMMIWKSILSAATVRGVNLEKVFDLHSFAGMVGDDGYPRASLIAVMTRLISDTDKLKEEYIILSKDKTVQWVGIICLQRAREAEQANAEGFPQSEFVAQWHDLLPEGWREHASMDLLKINKSHSDPSKGYTAFSEEIYDPTSLDTLPPANTVGKANRKWHEKFKMGRK